MFERDRKRDQSFLDLAAVAIAVPLLVLLSLEDRRFARLHFTHKKECNSVSIAGVFY